MNFLLLKLNSGKLNDFTFVGVFVASDARDAKNKIRKSKDYHDGYFFTAATPGEIVWLKSDLSIKVDKRNTLPEEFKIENYKPLDI